MKKLITILLILLGFTATSQQHNVGWETGDLMQGVFLPYSLPYTVYSGYPGGYSLKIVDSVARKGTKCARFEVRQSDSAVGGNSRSEVYYSRLKTFADTLDKWAFSVRLPYDYLNDSKGEEYAQYHQPGNQSPAWGVGSQFGKPYLYLNFDPTASGVQTQFVIDLSKTGKVNPVKGVATAGNVLAASSLVKGDWVDWAVYYKRSTAADGIFRLYRNKVLVFERLGANYNKILVGGVAVDESTGYVKFGCYKYPWNSGTTTSDVSVRVIFHDEFKSGGPKTPMNAMFLDAGTPPTADAGATQQIKLPINTVTLDGTNSTDDGVIAKYEWSKVSGPSMTLAGSTNSTPTVQVTIAGTYVFQLKVTDNENLTATDTVSIVVLPANIIPSVNAGLDQTIQLPVTSTDFTATALDEDGSISNYSWTKVSGGFATLTNTNTTTLTASNLAVGTYVFRITVTDNEGATNFDDIQLTVLQTNVPPTVDAGINKSITLPINNISLTGIATDQDGTIYSSNWTQNYGPNTSVINPNNQLTTIVSGLVQGKYSFKLKATDNQGATNEDSVIVIVNPQVIIPANKAPLVSLGSRVTTQLPKDSVSLTSISSDPDGTIVSYQWIKYSGPSSYGIVTPKLANTKIINLVVGTYVFSLTVTDNKGAKATGYVSVYVNKSKITFLKTTYILQ